METQGSTRTSFLVDIGLFFHCQFSVRSFPLRAATESDPNTVSRISMIHKVQLFSHVDPLYWEG
ncbi:hypothetical protein BC940DRAFT_292972, partial [Gongronella butleri]